MGTYCTAPPAPFKAATVCIVQEWRKELMRADCNGEKCDKPQRSGGEGDREMSLSGCGKGDTLTGGVRDAIG